MMDGNIILSVAKAMEVLQILSQAESPLSLKVRTPLCKISSTGEIEQRFRLN